MIKVAICVAVGVAAWVFIATSAHAQLECQAFCECAGSGDVVADVTTSSDGWETHPLTGPGVSGTVQIRSDCVDHSPARGRIYSCWPDGPKGGLQLCITWVDAGPGQDNSFHWRDVAVDGYELLTVVGGVDMDGCEQISESSCPDAWGLVGFCDCRGVTTLTFGLSPIPIEPHSWGGIKARLR